MNNLSNRPSRNPGRSQTILHKPARLFALVAFTMLVTLMLSVNTARGQEEAVAAAATAAEPATTTPAEVAEQGVTVPFPDLMDMQGVPANFKSDFDNGQWTLVKIWQAHCPVCGMQAPLMSQAHNERDDLTVVGVTLDGKAGMDEANDFVKRHNPDYKNFIGEPAVVMLNFSIHAQEEFRGTPSYLLFNPENKLMAAQAGMINIDSLFAFIDRN